MPELVYDEGWAVSAVTRKPRYPPLPFVTTQRGIGDKALDHNLARV